MLLHAHTYQFQKVAILYGWKFDPICLLKCFFNDNYIFICNVYMYIDITHIGPIAFCKSYHRHCVFFLTVWIVFTYYYIVIILYGNRCLGNEKWKLMFRIVLSNILEAGWLAIHTKITFVLIHSLLMYINSRYFM